MHLFDKEKNESNESIYSVESNGTQLTNTKEFHFYTKYKATKNHKYILNADKSPAYFSEYHYFRPSNLKERFVSLYKGDSTDGPLVGQVGSNTWMTKFHYRDANGTEHPFEQIHKLKLSPLYQWTAPNGQTLLWKSTRQVDMEENGKKSKLRRGLKLVDEHDQVLAIFVHCKFAKRKIGKFILDTNSINSVEMEQAVLTTALTILEVCMIAANNAAAASSSASSSAAVAVATA
ncbi:hypothetical protein TWF694_007156 [Orbilia ellipsospora]|uniref:Tubby C-terminal domain-containing protein n=1 Tax=Orbilia ellipsospora TaxID=2528407 RepID=A0AAV9XKB2_9PEZI